FVFATFFLLVAVLYLSISRATITIVPTPRLVSVDTDIKVVANPDEDGELSGVILDEQVNATQMFTLPSEGATAVEAKAGGTVTLINETGSDQPLVGTTRLLSEEGVLFRIDKGTTVPAHGQVDVIAHADQAGLSGEIPPTQFTIPGLGSSLQTQIYAVSVDNMVGGVAYKRVLTEKDIQDAVASLSETLLAQAKSSFASQVDVSVFDGQTWFTEVSAQSSDQTVGAEISSFAASVTLNVTGVYYDLDAVKAYAESELNTRVPEGYMVANADTSTIQVTVESASAQDGVALLSVYFEGTSIISKDSQVLDRQRFVGRSPNEVITLLKASDAVEDASVSFTPFWLQRVPNLADHIKIVIE
ncbi:MAG: hypothetical protein NUV56_01750, partial [Candidatus Uhrbacteria bacterium]|nr:hypothetical protein [Candidatus Uhrbacteria bacterium]